MVHYKTHITIDRQWWSKSRKKTQSVRMRVCGDSTSAISLSVGIRGTRYTGWGLPGIGTDCRGYFFNVVRWFRTKFGVGPARKNSIPSTSFQCVLFTLFKIQFRCLSRQHLHRHITRQLPCRFRRFIRRRYPSIFRPHNTISFGCWILFQRRIGNKMMTCSTLLFIPHRFSFVAGQTHKTNSNTYVFQSNT